VWAVGRRAFLKAGFQQMHSSTSISIRLATWFGKNFLLIILYLLSNINLVVLYPFVVAGPHTKYCTAKSS